MSTKKPVIGLTTNMMTMDKYVFPGMERPYVNQSYIDALEASGMIPLLLPVLKTEGDVGPLLDVCDGIVLTGGYDIHPSFYGQDMRVKMGPALSKLDRFQLWVCRQAIERGMPVLGICRGHQLLNVARGGSLHQDISEQKEAVLMHFQEGGRTETAHAVSVETGSRLEAVFSSLKLNVNSFHHQSVDRPGEGLRVTARCADGTIEAMELAGHPFCVSVQWHPELIIGGPHSMLPLFGAFRDACAAARQALGSLYLRTLPVLNKS